MIGFLCCPGAGAGCERERARQHKNPIITNLRATKSLIHRKIMLQPIVRYRYYYLVIFVNACNNKYTNGRTDTHLSIIDLNSSELNNNIYLYISMVYKTLTQAYFFQICFLHRTFNMIRREIVATNISNKSSFM